MSNKEFTDSTLIQEFSYNLMEHYEMSWMQNRTPGLYRVVFYTIADILKHYKSKSNPKIGFVLKNNDGSFKFGAILMYHTPEDGDDGSDDKGNYTLEYTLHEQDMNDLDIVIDNHSDIFITCSTNMAAEIMNGRFLQVEYTNNLFVEAIDTLIKFMDANASETEDFTLTYQGVFTATVTVEGGEKVITIIPGDTVKQYVKGDSSL